MQVDFDALKKFYAFDPYLIDISCKAFEKVKDIFFRIDRIRSYNQIKILNAFHKNKLSYNHLNSTDGYGYSDSGREIIEKIFSDVFNTEDSLVRIQLVSGTQAITTMLFGVLRPNDVILSITGKPYDTLQKVIGIKDGGYGTLSDFGIRYKEIDLVDDEFDFEQIERFLKDEYIRAVLIQRSRGYSLRGSIDISKMKSIISFIKRLSPETIVMVDNCYGEFVEEVEPTEVGADIMAGSLIKNPGGTIAPCGGYIVGKKDLILMCADKLFTPGMGKEVGPSLGFNRQILQGLLFSPRVVAESLKVAVFSSYLLNELGFEVMPKYDEKRTDVIQAVIFNEKKQLVEFCKGIQRGCPVDSSVVPEPWEMPGYSHQIIMSAGGFVQGTSIELSCDAPIREPYALYMQGSSSFEIGLIGLLYALTRIRKM